MGPLLRPHENVPASNRIDVPSNPARLLEQVHPSTGALWTVRLFLRERSALCAPILARLVRLRWQARLLRGLLRQLRRRNPRPQGILPEPQIRLQRKLLGSQRLRLATRLHRLGRPTLARAGRRIRSPRGDGGFPALPPRRLPPRPALAEREIRQGCLGSLWPLRRLPPVNSLVRSRRAGNRPRHLHNHG